MIAWLRRLIRIRLRPHREAWRISVVHWADETFVDAVWSYRSRNEEKLNCRREREFCMLWRHLRPIEKTIMYGDQRGVNQFQGMV